MLVNSLFRPMRLRLLAFLVFLGFVVYSMQYCLSSDSLSMEYDRYRNEFSLGAPKWSTHSPCLLLASELFSTDEKIKKKNENKISFQIRKKMFSFHEKRGPFYAYILQLFVFLFEFIDLMAILLLICQFLVLFDSIICKLFNVLNFVLQFAYLLNYFGNKKHSIKRSSQIVLGKCSKKSRNDS